MRSVSLLTTCSRRVSAPEQPAGMIDRPVAEAPIPKRFPGVSDRPGGRGNWAIPCTEGAALLGCVKVEAVKSGAGRKLSAGGTRAVAEGAALHCTTPCQCRSRGELAAV